MILIKNRGGGHTEMERKKEGRNSFTFKIASGFLSPLKDKLSSILQFKFFS